MLDMVTIKGRKYPFIDVGTMIRINDEAQPYLAHLARTFPNEFNRALRHVGWWLHRELKEACYKGGSPGQHWPELSLVQKGRWFEYASGRRNIRSLTPWAFGRLVYAIGYKHEPEKQRVRIGWLSKSAARRAAELQQGFETKITPKMRRFWWALDAPLSKKTTLRTPARPLIEPMFKAKEHEIKERIEKRILGYLKKAKPSLRFAWAA